MYDIAYKQICSYFLWGIKSIVPDKTLIHCILVHTKFTYDIRHTPSLDFHRHVFHFSVFHSVDQEFPAGLWDLLDPTSGLA